MADMQLADVEASLQELDIIGNSVADFFCEDPATFKLEECCSIFHSFCEKFERAIQENQEREAAENHKRLQQDRKKLTRSVKRRSTGTISDQNVTDDTSALESVLTIFLSQRRPRRRPGGVTPVLNCPLEFTKNNSPQVEEHKVRVDLDTPAEPKEEQTNICDSGSSRVRELEDDCKTEEVARAASKKGQCIDDNLIPESSDCKNSRSTETSTRQVFVSSEDKGEVKEIEDMDKGAVNKKDDEEEVEKREGGDKMPELSRKVFRFKDCSGGLNGNSTPDCSRFSGVCISTPKKRDVREVDLALQNGLGVLGSPWTILSPRISPRNTPNRRHSFSFSRVDILDDGVWALPDTPVRSKTPHLAHGGKMNTSENLSSSLVNQKAGVQTSSSLPDCPSKRTPAQGIFVRSVSLTDEKEPPANFKLGQLFQRRTGEDLPLDKRPPETPALVSFFRRFGDRNRAGTVG